MPNEGFSEDFGGEKIIDDAMRGDKQEEAEGVTFEFMGFRIGQEVFVTGMQGEYVIKAFLPESNDVYLATSMDAEDEDMVKVAVDRLVKK